MQNIANLAIGDTLSDSVFVLRSLKKSADGNYSAVLSDRENSMPAVLSGERYDKSMPELVGGAVSVNGVVLNGTDMAPYVKIKSLARAEQGSYKASDLFNGLDAKHVNGYKTAIKTIISQIPDESCRLLCEKALDETTLDTLSTMPATVGYHGRYAGGALATAATVSKMAVQAGVQYQKWDHGLYGNPAINWSVLLTASLLHTLAVKEFYAPSQPWKRTEIGAHRGYFSLLQSDLEQVISANAIPIDDLTLSKVLNVLGCAVSMKTSVKATSPEGILFRHILLAYEDLDMLAEDIANHDDEDGSFFSSRSRRYMVIDNDNVPKTEERKGA